MSRLNAETIPVAQRATLQNLATGSHVWAKKIWSGEWLPATVLNVGRDEARVQFESGRRAHRFYLQLALRNPRRAGADRPLR